MESGWKNRWLWAVGFWALLVLIFSTRTEIRGEPFVWVRLTREEALKIALSQWTTWALLSFVIVWFDRRLPIRRDALAARVLCHVPLSVVFTVAYTYLHNTGLSLLDAPRDSSLLAGGFLATSSRVMLRNTTFFYWVIVGMYLLLDYQNHLKNRAVRNAELERLLSDARLAVLRSQVQPHFLFNALNTISSCIDERPRAARRMIEQLADLLRMSLDHIDEQEISLDRELSFVERYLQLQAARYEDQLTVSLTPDPKVRTALIPPFVLQPLVENAVRHGTSRQSSPGSIEVSAWRSNGRVCLRVSDNGPGLPAGWNLENGAGIGLANTRERLRQLYGDDNHSFSVVPRSGGGVCVDLSLPFHEA